MTVYNSRVPGARRGRAIATHAASLLLFAAVAVAWTWPLALHVGDALPGDPGDNYSFVWNLWWMRRVLATPGLHYFHTTYLFYPFGTTIADHPHTALPAFAAATALRSLSPAAAQNALLLAYLFGNLAAMYALAWTITRHVRAAIFAAAVFGLSPYVAVHLLGHFDLVAAFTIPLFALALARKEPVAAGAILAATAYIAYYYVVYLTFFTVVYLLASADAIGVVRATTPPTRAQRLMRVASAAGAAVGVALAIAIVATGGWSIVRGGASLSMRAPQNALTAAWALAIAAALLTWRPALRVNAGAAPAIRHALVTALTVGIVFVVGAAPLLWQAARLVLRGEYVTPEYGWRSIPHGIDLLSPLAGHPLHPIWGALARHAYTLFDQNYVETIGWFGVVPTALIAIASSAANTHRAVTRIWRAVAIVFFVWALGPFLVVGGFDTGLKLPAILLRYIPLVANARMPGRAIVVVYMAVAMLLAMFLSATRGPLRSAVLQWVLIGAVAFEYWAAPLRLTRLDRPEVYARLESAPPGAVCEVPLGLGDGLSEGVGSQDRRVLFYATQHEHPLVGGYIGRMPAQAVDRYRATPIVGTLLALSAGAPTPTTPDVQVASSPCRYLVVDRRAISAPLASYLHLLASRRLASDDRRDLLQIR